MQGPIDMGVLEQSACRWLACWPPSEAEAGGQGARALPQAEGLEFGQSSWGTGYSPFGLLCAVRVCANFIYFLKHLYPSLLLKAILNLNVF